MIATDATEMIDLLRLFRNVVLEGVPGTGKTFAAEAIAEQWQTVTERELASRVTITMHPSTAYEDSIEGLRPVLPEVAASFIPDVPSPGDSTPFGLKNGLLLEVCRQATADPERDYLLVLDELNRANVPKVLGDLLLVLEGTKRATWDGSDWSNSTTTKLAYSQRDFWVPDNVFVLGTMNTSDRSVAPLDTALRRRFAFLRLEPLPVGSLSELIEDTIEAKALEVVTPSLLAWGSVNEGVLRPCLGPDGMLGHSYLLELARAIAGMSVPDTTGWLPLYEELTNGVTGSGQTIEAAMWHETRTMTGDADNQLDLTKGGLRNPYRGSVHFFDRDPNDGEVVRIYYKGERFDGSELKYYAGGNGTWRLNLHGTSATTTLTAFGRDGDFLDAVLVFVRTPEGYELRRYTKDVMPGFAALSDSDVSRAAPTKARQYGFFHIRAVGAGEVIATYWQYAILPQLIETIVANGAEDLLDPERRASWFDSHPEIGTEREVAEATLGDFDAFITSLGLKISVMGSGLGRGPSVTRSIVAS